MYTELFKGSDPRAEEHASHSSGQIANVGSLGGILKVNDEYFDIAEDLTKLGQTVGDTPPGACSCTST